MIEREIENIVEQRLAKKGWIINSNNPKKNVYHQQPKTQEDKQKLNHLKPDFCLYLTEKSVSPEIILETKKPNMNLAKTKAQALNYAKLLNSKIIILFDGIQAKSYWVENQEELLKNGIEINSIENIEFYQKYILKNSNNIVDSEIIIHSKDDLTSVFSFANQKLRKAGITKGMERFF